VSGAEAGQLLVPHAVLVVPQLLVWVKDVPEQIVLVAGDQEVSVQATGQLLVPQAVRVVEQLLVWVKDVPEQIVLVAGDQEVTVQTGVEQGQPMSQQVLPQWLELQGSPVQFSKQKLVSPSSVGNTSSPLLWVKTPSTKKVLLLVTLLRL
jgi:hypothetical protein